ncbi:hypothetical protein OE88DRAFT_1647780 [Heliocybe sulcata]|uniref:Uncharacterized protein n=1 Tax=Heliocybe sulcata TaxID=5364 RepID=A0A5C3MRS2_9AGAM|nr:hypothetical protein OE88DRAFT_1647780 [Heliocybe sulcata]
MDYLQALRTNRMLVHRNCTKLLRYIYAFTAQIVDYIAALTCLHPDFSALLRAFGAEKILGAVLIEALLKRDKLVDDSLVSATQRALFCLRDAPILQVTRPIRLSVSDADTLSLDTLIQQFKTNGLDPRIYEILEGTFSPDQLGFIWTLAVSIDPVNQNISCKLLEVLYDIGQSHSPRWQWEALWLPLLAVYDSLDGIWGINSPIVHACAKRLALELQEHASRLLDFIDSCIVNRLRKFNFKVLAQTTNHVVKQAMAYGIQNSKFLAPTAFKESLAEDDLALSNQVKHAIKSPLEAQEILEFQGDDASELIDVLQWAAERLQNEDVPREECQALAVSITQMLLRLSEKSSQLPSSVCIGPVNLVSRDPMSGGGFADIFRASYHSQDVALKRF